MDKSIAVRKMLCHIPDELQDLVWHKYYSTFVMTELLSQATIHKSYEDQLDELHTLLHDLVNNMCSLKERSFMAFDTSVEFALDRFAEDYFRDTVDAMFILFALKAYIDHPQMLKLELQKYFDDLVSCPNAFLDRVDSLEKYKNEVLNVYHMVVQVEVMEDD